MKRFCALALVAAGSALAQMAPSDYLNQELPDWLQFSGEYRARVEGFSSGGYKPGNSDDYFLSRLRLNMLLAPTSWLRFFGQAQDSRVFGNGTRLAASPPYQDTMNLRLGYVELGKKEGSIMVRVGRQEILLGEQRLVGNVNWTNVARSFDAARVTLRRGGYRLDAFASSVVVAQSVGFDHHQDGSNLHGLYGGIERLVPNAVIEPYVLWRLAPSQKTEAGAPAKLDSKTTGFRWAGKLPAHFDYGTEIAIQRGSIGTDSVRAWAGHWVGGYTLPAPWKPRAFTEYNYASGDDNLHDGVRGTFDQLYPTGHDKFGLADQVGWRNIRDLRFGVESKPRAKMTLAASLHSFWLANAHDGLYNAAGTLIARVADGSAGTRVGEEIDVQSMYTFNKQIQAGVGLGHIFPGAFLKKATPGNAYTYPYLMAVWAF